MTKKKETVKAAVRKAPVKAPAKATVKKEEPIKIVIPKFNTLSVETIRSSDKPIPVFEKKVYASLPTKLESGHVRVIVLKDHKGMLNELYEGDILDLPERRFKSLAFRGMVKLYEGTNEPNKQR
jgi:hypothetical protein